WFLYDQESPIAHGGRGLARGRIYDLEGRLLVSVVQEGLFRPYAENAAKPPVSPQ
ncbi:acyl-CoA thioesterase, partial [Streptomyces sp. NRRL S-444]